MRRVRASSFADLADVAAFRRCKAKGHSDAYCFQFGDNGIGFAGMNCATDALPICALPPDDWKPKFGAKKIANGAPVAVTYKGKTVVGLLGDTMPWKKNIKNACSIDLNPGFAKAFGLKAPFIVPVTWAWAPEARITDLEFSSRRNAVSGSSTFRRRRKRRKKKAGATRIARNNAPKSS